MPAFRRAPQTVQPAIGTVTRIQAGALTLRYGSARLTAWPAAPLTIGDLAVGDTVTVSWHGNVAYATAILARNLKSTSADVSTAVTRYVNETIISTPLAMHPLFSDYHSGELAQSQAPWALEKYGTRWAFGDLQGYYGYTDDVVGVALGTYAPDEVWMALDSRNGQRMMLGSLCLGQWTPYGTVVSGSAEGGMHIAIDGSQGRISFKDKDNELAAFDATTLSMLGFQRWGIPLGPCLEAGVVKDVDANGDPLLDANGIPQERYRLAMLAENGVPVIGFWSGTKENPWNAAMRVGAADAAEYFDFRDGSVVLSGGIYAQSGSIEGPLTIGINGGIYQGTGSFASPTTGLKLWNSGGVGLLTGYNGGVVQAYFDTDGTIKWAGGKGVLSSYGIVIDEITGKYNGRGIFWVTDTGLNPSGQTSMAWGVSGTGPGIGNG